MARFLASIHPKVKWPAIINAILTIIGTIATAFAVGDRTAITTGVVGGAVTVVGLITGYTVPSPVVTAVEAMVPSTPPVSYTPPSPLPPPIK